MHDIIRYLLNVMRNDKHVCKMSQYNLEYFQYFQKLSIVDFMCSAMLSFKDLLLMGFSSIIMSHCGGSVLSRKQRPENSSGTILPELFSGRRPLCTSAICIGSSV